MSTIQQGSDAQVRRQSSLWVQVTDLFLIEMTNWRWSWRYMLLTATLTPMAAILGMGVFARDSGPEALAFVLTGNAVVSLIFGTMSNVESRFSFMRLRGGLDYYSSLPVRRYALIVAVVLSFLLLSLPSLVVTVGLGALILGVRVALHPVVLIVVPLCAVCMAGVGALIGCSVPEPSQGGAINLLVTMIMMGLGPVLVPPDRLPGVLLVLGRLSPATYAASALRQALLGPVTGQILVDLVVLAAISAVVLGIVGQVMDWRQR